jgi:hypothetical protein
MCNPYSTTKGQQAIRDLAGAMRDLTGNLPMLPGVFRDYSAPIVRTAVDGVRELAMARWGIPSPTFAIAGAHLPASHRRGFEPGGDLGSRLFRCCVSYMLARLRQRLAQPCDRSICRPQLVEVAIPHQFGLAERGCASEDGLTSALLHIRHLPLQFGDAPVRIDERPVAQLSVAHENQILRRLSAPSFPMPRDRSPRTPMS